MDSKLVILKYYQQAQPLVSNTQNTISGILNQLSSIFFTGTGQFANLGNIEQQDLIKTANLTFGNNTRISNYLKNLEAKRDGFLYIFVANETFAPIDFENLIVIHKTGIV